MSMTMVTTALAISAVASSQSGGGGCPVSDYGRVCLGIFGAMMVLAVILMIIGATADFVSKRFDWCMGGAFALLAFSIIPIVVGMIHDC